LDLDRSDPNYQLYYAYVNLDNCEGNIPLRSISVYQSPTDQGATVFLTAEMNRFKVNLSKKYHETCNVSLITQIGNSVTSSPQILTVNLNLPICSGGKALAGDIISRKIDNALNSFETQFLMIYNEVYPYYRIAKMLCDLGTDLGKTSNVVNEGEVGYESTAEKAIDAALPGTGTAIDESLNGIFNSLFESSKYLVKYGCPYVTCNESKEKYIEKVNRMLPQTSFMGYQLKLPDDPNKCIFSAIAGFCIPGIMNNLYKYSVIEINYLECLNTSLSSGMPVSVCDQEKNYLDCKFVLNQLSPLISGENDFTKALGQINVGDFFDPSWWASSAVAMAQFSACSANIDPGLCRFMNSLGKIMDNINNLVSQVNALVSETQGIVNMGQSLTNPQSSGNHGKQVVCGLAKEYNQKISGCPN
ncbi:MAG: hypothetical protein GWP09_02215, partial [Nitrospiraceae bacterium]|nr:hypothetical protein [Nitrospiraceae bacterium]